MHRNYLRCIAAAAMMTISFAPAANAADYALVVGANQCRNYIVPGRNAPDNLEGAENDAKDFARLLQTRYKFPAENIHLLIGNADGRNGDHPHQGPATFDAIKKQFTWFKDNIPSKDIAGSENRFVFYFAGHGTQVPDGPTSDEVDKLDEALCPSDAAVNGNGAPVNLIVDDNLNLWLREIPVQNITVVLDCCHAGTATKGERDNRIVRRSAPGVTPKQKLAPWKDLQRGSTGPQKTIIAVYACRADQPAIERFFPEIDESRGQFTKLLIDHLAKPENSDELGKLTDSTKNAIIAWANDGNEEVRGLRKEAGEQTPTYEPADAADKRLIENVTQ